MIDEKRILENLKAFSFPRLSGTESEKNGFKIAKNKIERLNLTPSVQEFSFSTFYSRVYPKVSLFLLFWLHLTLFLKLQIIFMYANLIIVLIVFVVLICITRNPEKIKIGRKYNSQNLFVKLPFNSKEDKEINKNILLFSHLDSKGQIFSVKLRIILYYIWIVSFTIGLPINILNSWFFYESILLFYTFGAITVSINGIATILLLINTTNNKSKGAIDNASGISCVMELLNYYLNPEVRLKNYNLWFVFTGAEETGTIGVRNFYKYIKNFDREKNFIINFDCVAKHVELYNHGLINDKNLKSIKYISENTNSMTLVNTKRIYIGFYSDGIFLHKKKFKGLGNGDKNSYNYVHSKNDCIDKIDILFLKKLCKFITILLNDNDF